MTMAAVHAAGASLPAEVTAEARLARHLRGLKNARGGYFAVHLHLSRLQPANRKPHFIRVAANAFAPLTVRPDSTLFTLSNSDLALVCRDVPIAQIDIVIAKVRTLFNEDPLTFGAEGTFEDRLTTWYDLSADEDLAAFQVVAEELTADAVKRARQRGAGAPFGSFRGLAGRPLAPVNLAAVDQKLQSTPIADLVRRQAAVRVRAGGAGEVVFREHYISVPDLQKRIAPKVNLFASPWLFQYLTETLDRRLLKLLASGDFDAAEPVSLNLNIATVLSSGFRTFHRRAGGRTAGMVVELQAIDVFADLGAYERAREALRERGYRVLIDGLSPLALQFFDPGLLGADLVKLNWGPECRDAGPGARAEALRPVVERAGAERFVVGRVDSEEAVRWGLDLGIHRFQGRFIDPLAESVSARAARVN